MLLPCVVFSTVLAMADDFGLGLVRVPAGFFRVRMESGFMFGLLGRLTRGDVDMPGQAASAHEAFGIIAFETLLHDLAGAG